MSQHTSALAIETAGLVKTFGDTRAVDGVDLSVPAGTVHGVLGPNGARCGCTTASEGQSCGIGRTSGATCVPGVARTMVISRSVGWSVPTSASS